MPRSAEQLELFGRAQAHEIMLKARHEVMESWQHEVSCGYRKPPSAEGFITITHSINKLFKKGEK